MSVYGLQKVLPGNLRLPPSRRSGPDLTKLVEQCRRFGASADGMPPIQVTPGADGEMAINDGVTRATRIHRYGAAGAMVWVEVIDLRPKWNLTALPRISET